MRAFRIIFGYELRQQLQKKTVRVTTLAIVVLVLLITSLPRILSAFSLADLAGPSTAAPLTEKAGYLFAPGVDAEAIAGQLGLGADNRYSSREDLVAALKKGQIRVGFQVASDTAYEVIYQDKGMENTQAEAFRAFMINYQKAKLLAARGLTQEDFAGIESYQPQVAETLMGKATANNMLMSMLLMISVYMMVLLYGQGTATVIAREKDSKAMELLITSTRPAPLIVGKVAASGLSGVLQFGLIVGAALLGIALNQQFYPPELRQMLSGAMSLGYILSFVFFTITGYTLYLFLYAALGSTVSRVEDVGSAVGIVSFIFVIGYLATTFAVQLPKSPISVIASLFPFTSIMVMPIRAGIITVPGLELAAAGLLMILFILLFAWLSIKIYRWGSLNYGNKTSLVRIVKEALRR
ncbi:MAG: ABC transporter permease [Christensenellales bacterium]